MERGKQKVAKKEVDSNSNSKEDFGQQMSSSGAGTTSTVNLKEIEPLLKNFLQNFNNHFQSRWNEGWADLQEIARKRAKIRNRHSMHFSSILNDIHHSILS